MYNNKTPSWTQEQVSKVNLAKVLESACTEIEI